MKTYKRPLLILNILIIACLALVLTDLSHAADDSRSPRGETAYTMVTGIDQEYLTTRENRFAVSKDTIVHDENGEPMKYAEIKKFSMVRVLYRRVNGRLIANDIIIKRSLSEKPPE